MATTGGLPSMGWAQDLLRSQGSNTWFKERPGFLMLVSPGGSKLLGVVQKRGYAVYMIDRPKGSHLEGAFGDHEGWSLEQLATKAESEADRLATEYPFQERP